MGYSQITQEERYMISAMRKEKKSIQEIAEATGRHRSTIQREVKRNSDREGAYRAGKADQKARSRRRHSHRNFKFGPDQWAIVDEYIKKDWSPEQISNRLSVDRILEICTESIYQHVWRDKANGGGLHVHLRQYPKKRRKRRGSNDSRGRLPGKRHISERPASAENRTWIGHWEADTVVGSGDKHCVVTLVERRTGRVEIGKMRARNTTELNKKVITLIERQERRFRTITADNGTEFHSYVEVEKATGVEFFFATPYHSWERGTNENTNGLIRQYLPKRKSMKHITQEDCDRIAEKLNNRPRKRLGYRTPNECYHRR